MPNCSFCDSQFAKGFGMMYVKKDGTIYYFCSSKCRKNSLGLSREGRRQKWTPSARKFKAGQARKNAGEAKPAARTKK